MKIALIQLSDIHLTANPAANPILTRDVAIARAVASVCHGVEHRVIVVSGDTAFSGKQEEYEHGQSLIESIRAKTATSLPGSPLRVLTIPGNHDCDFGLSDTVRDIVLESLKPGRVIDDAVIAQCSGIQRHYFEFADAFDLPAPGAVATGTDKLYRQVTVDVGGKTIVFHLLNSAWVSQLREKAGSLYFPVQFIKDRVTGAPQADLVVAAVHHPFNWYWPENSRELRQCLEDHADIILTGHEYVPGAYGKRTDAGEQNDYLEGGVLQETGKPEDSSFNVVILDLDEKRQQTYRFVWRDDQYTAEGEPYWRPFERNKRLTRNQFLIAEEFGRWLEDPGADYAHAHKDPLCLSDIFVYPDLQEMQYQREAPERPLIRSREVVTYVLNNPLVLIVAEDKAGKTSLAKSLVRDLHRNGKIPLLLDGEAFGSSMDADRLGRIVDCLVDEQYGSGHIDRFRQLPPDQRVAVVDDFHKGGGNRRSKDQAARLLRERFGRVVFLTGEGFSVEDITSPATERSTLWDFKRCQVMEFGHVLRHTLISKWCRLGRDYSDEEADLQRQIKRAEDQISVVIRIDLLPSLPVYILILLQQLETASKLTTSSGSFGYLYEVLVTASLSRQKSMRVDLETKYNYLTEFAYHLFLHKKRSLSEDSLRAWHAGYCNDYKLTLDFGILWGDLVETGVIELRHGEYRFRYKYLYYFFVGRYCRDHIGEAEIQDAINALSRRLHHEESANIMIFLCHLSKDERVLGAMLEAAKSVFPAAPRFDVAAQAAFLKMVKDELPKLTLTDGNTADNRIKLLEARDERDRQAAASKPEEAPPEPPEPDEEMKHLLMYNAGFKTIQILGQVLRNFTGSLKGTPKRQLVEECYALGLRMLGSIFAQAEAELPGLVRSLVEFVKSRPEYAKDGNRPLNVTKLELYVNRLFFGLLHAVAFGVFKHISNSVGTEKVAQTFAEIVEADKNPSVRVIDLSIRLDHYKQFPKAQIEEMAADFETNIFAMSIVRHLVWHHLYLFPVDYQLKQHACQQVGISLEKQPQLLAHEPKKSNSSATGTAQKQARGKGPKGRKSGRTRSVTARSNSSAFRHRSFQRQALPQDGRRHEGRVSL